MAKCKEPALTEEDLESQLKRAIDSIRIDQKTATKFIEILRAHHLKSLKSRNVMIDVWQAEAKQARKRLDSLLEMRLSREITAEQFTSHSMRYQADLESAESNLANSNHDANEWLELAEKFFSQVVTLSSSFEKADEDEKRRLLFNVGSNWTISNKKVVFEPRRPYDLLIKIPDHTKWRALADEIRTFFSDHISHDITPIALYT